MAINFKHPKIRLIGIILAILFILAISGTAVYFYLRYQETVQLLTTKTAPADESKKIIEKVGQLILLPSDEQPTIATVTDPQKLKDQPFFTNAQNGDKVIIFANAKKAILFRPSVNKIIDVAPVNIGTSSATPATSTAASPSPKTQSYNFVLFNGTTKVGLTQKYEKILKNAIPNAVVVDRDNAKKNDYTKSIFIDISGTKSKEADQIAKLLNITVEKLPADEVKPSNADFLIILGSDAISE